MTFILMLEHAERFAKLLLIRLARQGRFATETTRIDQVGLD